jgi:hypothetical protein
MQTATLLRDEIRSEVIRGSLSIADKTFQILERPWKHNQRNESCIPAGDYLAVFLPQTDSGKYQNIYQLQSVPGRSDILIHAGNLVEHSRGCLLIGMSRGTQDGKPAVLDSLAALAALLEITQRQNFWLKIIGEQQLV